MKKFGSQIPKNSSISVTEELTDVEEPADGGRYVGWVSDILCR